MSFGFIVRLPASLGIVVPGAMLAGGDGEADPAAGVVFMSMGAVGAALAAGEATEGGSGGALVLGGVGFGDGDGCGFGVAIGMPGIEPMPDWAPAGEAARSMRMNETDQKN